jgi:UDP-N-acetylglucosamine diphosphorylase/glucosamine-1-phosphate N-acetyltransferase
MQDIVLFEDAGFSDLLPLTYWRTVFGLRCGRKMLIDRLAFRLGQPIAGLWTRDWMAAVAAERYMVPVNAPAKDGTILVNGRWLIDGPVDFKPGPFAATFDDQILYLSCDAELATKVVPADFLDPERCGELLNSVEHAPVDATMVRYPWDLVAQNAAALTTDWQPSDRGLEGQVSSSAHLIEPDMVYVGPGAHVDPTAVIDATGGPVYIAENTRIRPQVCISGPAYVGPGSIVNPHCHIHGGTSIGPVCKVGGEIDSCVIAGYTNKQHNGFLGHSYVGSWVNIGAETVNSDLKNTYGPVRASLNGREVDTGMIFYGSVIADHVKTGIGQTLPTGASIGFASMVASSRLPSKFVPSFTWLTDDGPSSADPERLLATARKMMQRREVTCTGGEAALFTEIARRARHYEANSPA